jgi:hypothetical protein
MDIREREWKKKKTSKKENRKNFASAKVQPDCRSKLRRCVCAVNHIIFLIHCKFFLSSLLALFFLGEGVPPLGFYEMVLSAQC